MIVSICLDSGLVLRGKPHVAYVRPHVIGDLQLPGVGDRRLKVGCLDLFGQCVFRALRHRMSWLCQSTQAVAMTKSFVVWEAYLKSVAVHHQIKTSCSRNLSLLTSRLAALHWRCIHVNLQSTFKGSVTRAILLASSWWNLIYHLFAMAFLCIWILFVYPTFP